MARLGWDGVWAVGVVRARGCGHALAAFKNSKRKPGVGSGGAGVGWWAVGVVRARGGVGTHWQPLNIFSPRKCEPSLGSGEEMRARWGAGGGGGESAGGCGHALAAFKYSLNT